MTLGMEASVKEENIAPLEAPQLLTVLQESTVIKTNSLPSLAIVMLDITALLKLLLKILLMEFLPLEMFVLLEITVLVELERRLIVLLENICLILELKT
jgi:hypothetical protein